MLPDIFLKFIGEFEAKSVSKRKKEGNGKESQCSWKIEIYRKGVGS
jgi:hypothetical protein